MTAMTMFLQQVVNGLALGAVYGLFAAGFGLVFSTLGVLNLAQGSIATMGALGALWVAEHSGLPFVLAALAGIGIGGLVSVIVYGICFYPLLRKGPSFLEPMITSIGAWMVLTGVAEIATGGHAQRFPEGSVPGGLIHLGDVILTSSQAIVIVGVIVVGTLLHLLLSRTRFGAATRAVSWRTESAQIVGVNTAATIVGVMFLAGAVTGLAGIASGATTDFISMNMGSGLLIAGFAAVVLGGVGDVRGGVIGGLLIGLAEVLGAYYISSSYRDAITFSLLLVLLLTRPSGLFGELKFGATR